MLDLRQKQIIYIYIYMRVCVCVFNKFPDFFVQAFKIVVDIDIHLMR